MKKHNVGFFVSHDQAGDIMKNKVGGIITKMKKLYKPKILFAYGPTSTYYGDELEKAYEDMDIEMKTCTSDPWLRNLRQSWD